MQYVDNQMRWIENPWQPSQLLGFQGENINRILSFDTNNDTLQSVNESKTDYNSCVVGTYRVCYPIVVNGAKPNTLIIMGMVSRNYFYSFYNVFNCKEMKWKNMNIPCQIDLNLHSYGMRAVICQNWLFGQFDHSRIEVPHIAQLLDKADDLVT